MKKLSYEGFGAEYLTFNKATGATIKKGDFVSLCSNNTVTASIAGEIAGKCVDLCGDLVTVQVKGYMTAPILEGETLALGRCHLGLSSTGKLKIISNAPSLLVVNINSANNEAGFILF